MLCELRQVKKYFPIKKGFLASRTGFVKAVDNIDLKIKKGENFGLVGESGSGKTTLGRILLKLLPLDSGTIFFEGNDITRLSTRAMRPYRQDIQMVFQDPYSSLDPRFSVRRIILESMVFDRKKSMKEKLERIEDLLTAVNLRYT